MKDFLQKHVTLLSAIVAGCFVLIFLMLMLIIGLRENQQRVLQQTDQIVATVSDLPGPKQQISDRSKKEIDVLFQDNPNVVGIYVTKIHYAKTENPIFFYIAKNPLFLTMLKNYDDRQKAGLGYSSAELNKQSNQSLRNSEEAKTGLIRCDALSSTNIAMLAPGIEKYVNGVCRATIPPFDEDVNLGLVVLIKSDGTSNGEDIQEIRRTLLRLQIDIYNRDFKGRETWAHP